MNYIRQYAKLIETRLNRPLLPGVYYEKHHIIPRCVCESKAVVSLTYREHIIAHHLLYKAFARSFGLESDYTIKVRLALWGTLNDGIASRKQQSAGHRINVLNKLRNLARGPLTKEHRKKISEAVSGTNNHFYGKSHTQESREKMSQALSGREFAQSHKDAISKSTRGARNSMYGKDFSDEHRYKLSISRRGSKHPLFDKQVYHWINDALGKSEVLTVSELAQKYGLSVGGLYPVKNGKRKSYHGWAIF